MANDVSSPMPQMDLREQTVITVALDDPAAMFFPADVSLPHDQERRDIRLIDLVTHSAGLPRLPPDFAPANRSDPYADYTVEQLYAFLSGYELSRDIGSKVEYSNLGVGLPIDVLVVRADACEADLNHRIEAGEPYFHDLRSRWSAALRAAHQNIPRPPYKSETEAKK